jgi:hypothetical protein
MRAKKLRLEKWVRLVRFSFTFQSSPFRELEIPLTKANARRENYHRQPGSIQSRAQPSEEPAFTSI